MLTHANLTGQVMTALYTSGAIINSDVGFRRRLAVPYRRNGNMLTGLRSACLTVTIIRWARWTRQLLIVLGGREGHRHFLVPAQQAVWYLNSATTT